MDCTFLIKNKVRHHPYNRGFTLVELMVSMSIGTVVMLAVFSTYLYLGRNLTRLSYRSVLENQSRKILNTFTADFRNARSIANPPASAPSANTLTLNLTNGDLVVYNFSANKLTRNLNGSGAVPLNYDIRDSNATVIVDLLPPALPSPNNAVFRYFTSSEGDPVSQFTPPAITPLSIKQVALGFTLQTGNAAFGNLTSYQVTTGRMLLSNRQIPDGN